MMIIARSFAVVAFGLAASGCVGVRPRQGFSNVQNLLSDRIANHLQWRGDPAADQAMDQQINDMLSRPLTADDAVQIALLQNRHLQTTYEELGIAQADLVQAGLLKNPVFNGDLKFGDAGRGTKVELAVAADFLDVLFIPMRKSIAKSALQGVTLRVSVAVIALAAEARTTYYALQAAMQAQASRRMVLQASEAAYELSKRINAAGNNTRLDLAEHRAMYEESKLDLAAAEAEANDLHEHLAGILGLWGKQIAFTVEGRLPDLPVEEIPADGLERRAIAQSLDLKIAAGAMTLAEKELGLTKPLGTLSDIEVGLASERELAGAWETGPSIALPIPIFSQGQPAVASAHARLTQARQNYFALAVDVRSGARSAYKHTYAARQRADYYRLVMIPLRQSITQETQKQYNAMQVDGFRLLQAKRAEVQADRDFVEALRDYWLAKTELDEILAGHFTPSDRPLLSPMLELKRGNNAGGQ